MNNQFKTKFESHFYYTIIYPWFLKQKDNYQMYQGIGHCAKYSLWQISQFDKVVQTSSKV